ncbi:hypothetical protein BD324DRAFT_629612 [Kockovaella imperatae]|uniref:Extracellular membrane protein CFEM domain-containing protein n=1 Tax=Kockovaella imperatae TaxID=4999 RepID=A0A1Y1UD17_9TREE|nr:hypothetical protein BD324DRAFT_629612 [Kockovaella imperatae]ORX35948.1 hypothetical protein BD324DRAFT_629612 [Kockovaella imperatae]
MTSRATLSGLLSTIVVFLLLIPCNALASAAKQFHLDPERQASKCWVQCHAGVIDQVEIPALKSNGDSYLKQNCELKAYEEAMTQCFALYCQSAPDAAYAAEFARRICEKAGINVAFALPEPYVEAASAYFESQAYLTGAGVRLTQDGSTPFIGLGLAFSIGLAVMA